MARLESDTTWGASERIQTSVELKKSRDLGGSIRPGSCPIERKIANEDLERASRRTVRRGCGSPLLLVGLVDWPDSE